jgi:PhzF family phenazine biosynthesis protein
MRIYQVDAFAAQLFEGNPAGVCLLPGPADESWMQCVAMEMNLSETAFLYKTQEGWHLRWFTPEMEVDLCGHATLASAHILWDTGVLQRGEEALFFTKSGKLSVKKERETIWLDFPAEDASEADMPQELRSALGCETVLFCGKNRMDYLVELVSETNVRALQPDYGILSSLSCRGLIVTSRACDSRYDFVSRFFAPAAGIPEDPVTGSAHCCLGPYWKRRLGKSILSAYQASKRGGEIKVEVKGQRVLIGGRAVTVFSADLSQRHKSTG